MQLEIGEKIRDDHFKGTFMFPDDLDFIGDVCKTDFLCGIFNDMIQKRITARKSTETTPQVKKMGKLERFNTDYHVEIYNGL